MSSIATDRTPVIGRDTEGDRGAAGTMLDLGALPVEELARLGARESWRPRPIYHAHRWFGRRLGTTFRALLTAAALSPDGDFWSAYYDGITWAGRTVLDPFVGGG